MWLLERYGGPWNCLPYNLANFQVEDLSSDGSEGEDEVAGETPDFPEAKILDRLNKAIEIFGSPKHKIMTLEAGSTEVAKKLKENLSGTEVLQWFEEGPTGESFLRAKKKAEEEVAEEKRSQYEMDLGQIEVAMKRAIELARKWKREVKSMEPTVKELDAQELFEEFSEMVVPKKLKFHKCD
jgi:hypothetical protein